MILQGGLGNQMFQYAAGLALSEHRNCKLSLDISLLQKTANSNIGITHREYELGIFKNINLPLIPDSNLQHYLKNTKKNKLFKKLGLPYKKQYEEPEFTFDTNFFLTQPPVLVRGYFQSEKYFQQIAETIRHDFLFPLFYSHDHNITILEQIQNCCSVSVHVRRADYLHPAIAAQHGTCSEAYYKAAIQYIQTSFPTAVFYFFSDDAAWVKNVFTDHLPNSVLVKNNTGANSWKDMYLMSKCSHHIIANSSFSWWGAWLNDQPGKMVIAPKQWFADSKRNDTTGDLIPENWMRL